MHHKRCFLSNRATILALALVAAGCDDPAARHAQAVGLKTDAMNYHAASQRGSYWCWAACIQMVLSTQKVSLSQETIVAHVLGQAVDQPADPLTVMASLNELSVPSNGKRLRLAATIGLGPPPAELLIANLARGTPFIVALSPSSGDVGHAVVLTAAVYEDPGGDSRPIIHSILIRDPDPNFSGTSGKREMGADEYHHITSYVLLSNLNPP